MYIIKKFKRKIKLLLNRDYWKLRNNIILIYNASKVGSTTVYFNLKKRLPFIEILHIHFLSNRWLHEFKTSGKWLDNIKTANKVKDVLLAKPNSRIKIITLVRDPIARDISAVFQSWKTIFEINNISDLNINLIQSHLEKSEFNQTENWFETEFKDWTKIDILKLPFDKKKGYAIYNLKEYDILCLKLESLNNNMVEALELFLGIKGIKMKIKNSSIEKEGSALYNKVKESFRLPSDELQKIYDNDFITHFYSNDEIALLINKWSKKNIG